MRKWAKHKITYDQTESCVFLDDKGGDEQRGRGDGRDCKVGKSSKDALSAERGGCLIWLEASCARGVGVQREAVWLVDMRAFG